MLHDLLRQYLEEVEFALLKIEDAYVEQYQEEILTPNRVNLRIRTRFFDGSLLELNEAVIVEADTLDHLDYRYHLQDGRNRLLFRYDSTPHFPEIETFPHHKHRQNSIISSTRPSISQVVEEAGAILGNVAEE
ncbi:MAG: DUF6516 family protein [Syntrophobacteraceae bacterium]